MSEDASTHENTRTSPRAVASLEVDVTVEGESRRVLLVSQDIGAGGMFLRTTDPAPSWSRVELAISKPDGTSLTVGGEVVRSVSLEQAKAKRQAPGMAVAFDEISRPKRKQLIELVLDLCSRRPTPEEREAKRSQEPQTAAPAEPAHAPKVEEEPQVRIDGGDDFEMAGTDALLDKLDDILDEVESSQAAIPVLADMDLEAADQVADPLDLASSLEQDEEEADLELDLEAPEPPPPPAPAPIETPVMVEPAPPPISEPEPPPAPKAAPAVGEEPAIRELRVFLTKYKKALKGDSHYDVLLLKRDASHEKISVAYKKLLHKLKPPLPPEAMPEDLVKQLASVLGKIRKAFAILAKPDRKKAYDFLIDNEEEQA